ncbi:MAG: dioxygenase [Rhodocyclaceae bacterium]|nr:dioxygenase [Rhodocyclaceae bacterium]
MTAQPVLFLSHGSPMTAIEADDLGSAWRAHAPRLGRPDAIVMVSAHWMTNIPMVSSAEQPDTIHDFGGFPEALYRLRYPAPGAPALAERIKQRLTDNGLAAGADPRRGLDHGAWIPLMFLFPDADIPVLQVSVQPDRGAHHHLAVGEALAPLREENVLIIGSGHMTHNLRDLFMDGGRMRHETRAFRDWAHGQLMNHQRDALLAWSDEGPNARLAHPTPEHFLPLFVALGAAGPEARTEHLGGGTVHDILAADNYLFASA